MFEVKFVVQDKALAKALTVLHGVSHEPPVVTPVVIQDGTMSVNLTQHHVMPRHRGRGRSTAPHSTRNKPKSGSISSKILEATISHPSGTKYNFDQFRIFSNGAKTQAIYSAISFLMKAAMIRKLGVGTWEKV